MRITIGGPPGSGKGTIADLIAKEYGLRALSMGMMRREFALANDMTIDELNELGEKDPSTDEHVDRFQEQYGKENDDFVIDGRLSFYFIPDSIKLYIHVDAMEAAGRIFRANRDSEMEYSSVEEVYEHICERMKSDRRRYAKFYNVDCYNPTHFDHVIDSTDKTPEQVFEEVKAILSGYQDKDVRSS